MPHHERRNTTARTVIQPPGEPRRRPRASRASVERLGKVKVGTVVAPKIEKRSQCRRSRLTLCGAAREFLVVSNACQLNRLFVRSVRFSQYFVGRAVMPPLVGMS